MSVLLDTAAARHSPVRLATEDGARFRPGLQGSFQRLNAQVAATALDALASSGLDRVDDRAIRAGIESAAWPGRFEIVDGEPPVVIDGAHNPAAAAALRRALDDHFPGRPLVFVIGIARDKDITGVVKSLLGGALTLTLSQRERGHSVQGATEQPIVVATRAAHPRAAEPAQIAEVASRLGVTVQVAPSVSDALLVAEGLTPPGGVIAAAGSLYLVAEVREALGLAEACDDVLFDPWATR